MKGEVMKTIETKYLGPTTHKGSRIRATDGDNSIIVSYDGMLEHEDAHWKAAEALCHKLKWSGCMVQGETKNGYVFVFANDTYREIA